MTPIEEIELIEKKVRESIDKAFLDKLVHIAKLIGWDVDYSEIVSFYDRLHDILRIEMPENIEPYNIDELEDK